LLRIKLENLLSFGPDSPALELENLNILIGSNGCGKSNLIEAIALLLADIACRSRLLSFDKSIVLGVTSDPKPEHTVRNVNSKRPIMQSDASGPESIKLLKMEGGMFRICLQESKCAVGAIPNLNW
jgi:AAA15 family ATPase/GTPase